MKLTNAQIALVVNQDAGKVPSRMKSLRKLAKQYNLKLKMCEGPDTDSVVREALKNKKLKRLIIGGGDGTVSKAASLILRINPNIELAVLPLGTGNYYAKSLGLDKNLNNSFLTAINGETEKRHMCRANKREFLIGVNVGTTSVMFEEVTDEEKQKFGKLAYVGGIVRILRRIIPTELEIVANGETRNYKSAELVVINQYLQTKVHIMPEVKGSEEYFEIVTYGLGDSKLSPLFGFLIFLFSFGHNQKYLKRIKATKATINTKKPQPVAIDGDSLETTPVYIELIKTPIKFVIARSGA